MAGQGREVKLALGEYKASGHRGTRQTGFWEKADHLGF